MVDLHDPPRLYIVVLVDEIRDTPPAQAPSGGRLGCEVAKIQNVPRLDLKVSVLDRVERFGLQRVALIDQAVDLTLLLVNHLEDALELVGRLRAARAGVVIDDRTGQSLPAQSVDPLDGEADQVVKLSDAFKIAPVHERVPPDHQRRARRLKETA